MQANQDYILVWSDNKVPGEAILTIQGVGTYVGTQKDVTFKVAGDLSLATITVLGNPFKETGSDIYPTITVTGKSGTELKEGIDFEFAAYGSAAAVGEYEVVLVGAGDYEGSTTKSSFTIIGDLADAAVTGIDDVYPATGSEITPEPTVTSFSGVELVKGTDYTVGYADNTNVGTATITITGQGYYAGTKTSKQFNIKGDISKANVLGVAESYPATGSAIVPDPIQVSIDTTILTKDTDYTVDYSGNVDPGTASVIITGTGNYAGTKVVNFEIDGDISTATVSGVEASYEETGSAIAPKPTVKYGEIELDLNVDYTLTWENNVEPGTATITITGMGNYTNKKEVQFTITAKQAETSWNRLAGGSALTTMKQIVNEGWESSEWAVIATSQGYQDALAASALAGLLNNAPVLLTPSNELSNVTKNLLVNKGVKKAIIVGGTSAISEDVEKAVQAANNIETTRISGGTATTTAINVYKWGADASKTGDTTWGKDAIVATLDSFQDALSIAPYAYSKHAPIFLTDKGTKDIRLTVQGFINNGGFNRTIIVGGTGAVSETVDNKVISPKRLYGGSAYTTSKAIAQFALDEGGMTAANTGVACGTTYQDALTGAALCGKNNSILLLADDNKSSSKYTTATSIIKAQKDSLSKCYIFGGPSAVSEPVEAAIKEACQ